MDSDSMASTLPSATMPARLRRRSRLERAVIQLADRVINALPASTSHTFFVASSLPRVRPLKENWRLIRHEPDVMSRPARWKGNPNQSGRPRTSPPTARLFDRTASRFRSVSPWRILRCGVLVLLLLESLSFKPAWSAPRDVLSCADAISHASQRENLPPGLLMAIGVVESGRVASGSDGLVPWPWSVNVEGRTEFFGTKADAIAATREALARGARSLDVGCMQVSLVYHPDAFAALAEAFEPRANVAYAARFLRDLHDRVGTWTQAAALYHSATPSIGADYQAKVLARWTFGMEGSPTVMLAKLAAAWSATVSESKPDEALPVTVRLVPPGSRASEFSSPVRFHDRANRF